MRRVPWLIPALVAVALAGGCGSSSSSRSDSTPNPAGTSTASGAVAKLLVNACKRRIQNEPALTTSEKVELEPLCDKSASGVAGARQAAEEVCVEVIKRSASPGSSSTPARKQALAACKSAK
jgi:hypothetical protein